MSAWYARRVLGLEMLANHSASGGHVAQALKLGRGEQPTFTPAQNDYLAPFPTLFLRFCAHFRHPSCLLMITLFNFLCLGGCVAGDERAAVVPRFYRGSYGYQGGCSVPSGWVQNLEVVQFANELRLDQPVGQDRVM